MDERAWAGVLSALFAGSTTVVLVAGVRLRWPRFSLFVSPAVLSWLVYTGLGEVVGHRIINTPVLVSILSVVLFSFDSILPNRLMSIIDWFVSAAERLTTR